MSEPTSPEWHAMPWRLRRRRSEPCIACGHPAPVPAWWQFYHPVMCWNAELCTARVLAREDTPILDEYRRFRQIRWAARIDRASN